jgi:hypothetical protein
MGLGVDGDPSALSAQNSVDSLLEVNVEVTWLPQTAWCQQISLARRLSFAT